MTAMVTTDRAWSEPLRIAVVGAGIAGLSAAHATRRHLSERGVPVALRVFDANPVPGGQLSTEEADGFRFDWAANAFRTGKGATADLVTRLGLEGEQVEASKAAKRRFVFHGGRLHELPSGPGSLLRFRAISLAGRVRMVLEPFAARRVDREESVIAFASRHVGPEAAEVLLGTMVRGVYGGDAQRLSVDAAFPAMRTMERDHRSLLLAAVAGAKERKRIGATTWSFRRGLQTLTSRLAEDLGDAMHLATTVTHVAPRGVTAGYRLTIGPAGLVKRTWDADVVILATPPHVTRSLTEPFDAVLAQELAGIECGHLAVAAFAFANDAFMRLPEGYGFLVARGEPTPVLGALFESNVFPERAPGGHTLVRVILGGAGREDVLALSDAEIEAAALSLLDRAVGLQGDPLRSWVRRHPHAIPQYHLGHEARVASIDERLAWWPGLHVAGSAYRGVAVGAMVEDAERIALRIAEQAGGCAAENADVDAPADLWLGGDAASEARLDPRGDWRGAA